MEPPPKPTSTSLFQVYLRLRPSQSLLTPAPQPSLYPQLPPLNPPDRFLTVEASRRNSVNAAPTHITVHPINDSRKRAVEKFAFTQVFEEDASQLDVFKGTGVLPLIEGVLGEKRDGLIATLGVTGSGKTHTILGSKTQRGLTQLSLDVLYRSLKDQLINPTGSVSLVESLDAADACEARITSASEFLDDVYGDSGREQVASRAPSPVTVGQESSLSIQPTRSEGLWSQWSILGFKFGMSPGGAGNRKIPAPTDLAIDTTAAITSPSSLATDKIVLKRQTPLRNASTNTSKMTRVNAKFRSGVLQDYSAASSPRKNIPRQQPSALRLLPNMQDITLPPASPNSEYAILISMYEVYNDRIFDLLCHTRSLKELRRRPLLFKSTELSPDRKVVAGLRKVVCGSYDDALMVLETGLMERRVAGTGSNSVSSRSHGFFCVEVKRRKRGGSSDAWSGAQLTIVDLAGSERARNAKTAGATLAEAGKINESLMYLGQCLQMQSYFHEGSKPSIVPFRQCKLTELLFSNSFPSASHPPSSQMNHQQHYRNPQKAVMIVTADPCGDFNATSQILRYSALAREVTVPRIPSVSSTILSGFTPSHGSTKFFSANSGRTTPNDNSADMDAALVEIAKLTEQLNLMGIRVSAEKEQRREVEEKLREAEEMSVEWERDIREDCCDEMEKLMDRERDRWQDTLEAQRISKEELMNRKIEILGEHLQGQNDISKARIEALEEENDDLRHQILLLQRELHSKSPSKSRGRKGQSSVASISDQGAELQKTMFGLREGDVNAGGSGFTPLGKTPKKMRKLTGKKAILGDENSMESL